MGVSRRGQHGRPQFMVNTIAVISHPGATARVRALAKQVPPSRGRSAYVPRGEPRGEPRGMPYPALTARRAGTRGRPSPSASSGNPRVPRGRAGSSVEGVGRRAGGGGGGERDSLKRREWRRRGRCAAGASVCRRTRAGVSVVGEGVWRWRKESCAWRGLLIARGGGVVRAHCGRASQPAHP